MTGELKVFLIGFIGSADFRKVRAPNQKEAKNIFADHHGIVVSNQITIRKWTGENYTRALNDSRPALTRGTVQA
jgi:hypothetical protein